MPYPNQHSAQARKLIKEEALLLQMHYTMSREKMSETIAALIRYCNEMAPTDPLIYPVKENPFKEKRSCIIL